ncbi:MAG: sensor histidine kinase, partial [Pseudomonadota bacterium]
MGALSLRARAVLGGAVWIIFAVGLSGYLLLGAFDGIAERSFARNLSAQLDQLESLILTGAMSEDPGQTRLADPRYLRAGSGYYWQVERPDGTLVRSPSLQGEILPIRSLTAGEEFFTARAPEGFQILVIARGLRPQGAGDGDPWRVYAAEAVVRLQRDKLEFRRTLFTSLIGLGGALTLAAAAMTGMALRPLVALRAAFGEYRRGDAERIEGAYPSDIEPLVGDLNELLERNGKIISTARRQAADLAHALKTPAAVLRNEIEAPEPERPAMRDALGRIETQLTRYTARARLAGANAPGASSDVREIVEGLGRVMERIYADRGVALDLNIPEGLRVRMEGEDLEELSGNLIDNAFKWAEARVAVTAARGATDLELTVEDDGPGVPEDERDTVLRAGARLDEAVPGTGLGLAICSDIAEAYEGELTLDASALGGLMVRVRLPLVRGEERG